MSFVSYAQNFEDVILYRALKNIDHGFYIDVGALHPEIASVTKAFYDRDWHGINIEPIAECFRVVASKRPKDINLNLAASNRQGRLLLNEISDVPGDSTTSDFIAEMYKIRGHKVRSIEVPCTTLDKICEENKVETIHFLKIDVEGGEKEVLEGFSFEKVRPWVVVIEANEPNSTSDVSYKWSHLIERKKYDFVYYDGLNRFYLAKEHIDLRIHFNAPPNVFDNYILSTEYLGNIELAKLKTNISSLEDKLAKLKTTISSLEDNLALEQSKNRDLVSLIGELSNSVSWRITSPLRKGRNEIARLSSLTTKLIKNLIKAIFRFLFRFRWLVLIGSWILRDLPGIRTKIGAIKTQSPIKQKPYNDRSIILDNLPESSRAIYINLKNLYEMAKRKE